MKLFKKKIKPKPLSGVYLLYSKDGEAYKIIADIAEEADDVEPHVLDAAPLVNNHYCGDGYYLLARNSEDTYRPKELKTRWQFLLISSTPGDMGGTFSMMRNDMDIARQLGCDVYTRNNYLEIKFNTNQ